MKTRYALLLLLVVLSSCKSIKDLGKDIGKGRDSSSGSSATSIQVFFSRPDDDPRGPGNIADSAAGYIDMAKESIDVCAFELDNRVIIDALVAAKRRGVTVRLVTETDYIDEVGVKDLKAAGVPVVDDKRDGALMHNKFMVFDHAAVWTGSMNFTENCAYKNDNHGVYIKDNKLAENYSTKFTWMFQDKKFGGLPNKTDRIPNPEIELSDGTPIENYFATHDHPASHVIEVLKTAKKSIHFLAFSFTHTEIAATMMEAAKHGVAVSGVFETSQGKSKYSAYHKMHDADLPVFLDANPRNMHHKVIIIDGEIVVCGSFNFSSNADKTNDENLLIIHNKNVAERFEKEFQRVMAKAKKGS
ncbi:phospholipase D-like domain-containing protein [soil metagenome]